MSELRDLATDANDPRLEFNPPGGARIRQLILDREVDQDTCTTYTSLVGEACYLVHR